MKVLDLYDNKIPNIRYIRKTRRLARPADSLDPQTRRLARPADSLDPQTR